MSTVRVVVLELRDDLAGTERVAAQSAVARRALEISARASGAVLGALEKDEGGAPLPSNGWHWSLTHAGAFAAGVVCRAPVGVDVARIEPRRPGIVTHVTSRDELELLGGFSWGGFMRVWTAKEAVLKKARCGLSELSRCILVAVPDEATMVLSHRDRNHVVHQIAFADHVAALACDDDSAADGVRGNLAIEWMRPEIPTPAPSAGGCA